MGLRQGCTNKFWRKCENACHWIPTGYSRTDDFDTVFGIYAYHPDITLKEALKVQGYDFNGVARAGVAALLNAAHPAISYPLTKSQVISKVQHAYNSGEYEEVREELEAYNSLGCPLKDGSCLL